MPRGGKRPGAGAPKKTGDEEVISLAFRFKRPIALWIQAQKNQVAYLSCLVAEDMERVRKALDKDSTDDR